jgi:hypothetical protein
MEVVMCGQADKSANRTSPNPPLTERRAFARIPCDQEIALRPAADPQATRWAGVRNISRNGVGLLLSTRLCLGAVLALELRCRNHRFLRTVLGRVVHARPCQHQNWVVGCAFEKSLSDDSLRALQT